MDNQGPGLLEQVVSAAVIIFLSFFGGVISYLMELEKQGHAFMWGKFFINGMIGGFIGMMILLLCDMAGLNFYVAGFLSGMSAANWREAWPFLRNHYQRITKGV